MKFMLELGSGIYEKDRDKEQIDYLIKLGGRIKKEVNPHAPNKIIFEDKNPDVPHLNITYGEGMNDTYIEINEVEINSLEELLAIRDKLGALVIGRKPENEKEITGLVVYNDYLE